MIQVSQWYFDMCRYLGLLGWVLHILMRHIRQQIVQKAKYLEEVQAVRRLCKYVFALPLCYAWQNEDSHYILTDTMIPWCLTGTWLLLTKLSNSVWQQQEDFVMLDRIKFMFDKMKWFCLTKWLLTFCFDWQNADRTMVMTGIEQLNLMKWVFICHLDWQMIPLCLTESWLCLTKWSDAVW